MDVRLVLQKNVCPPFHQCHILYIENERVLRASADKSCTFVMVLSVCLRNAEAAVHTELIAKQTVADSVTMTKKNCEQTVIYTETRHMEYRTPCL